MHEKINEIYGYLHGLWRYRWSALLIAWIVGVIGWIAVYSMPDEYVAKTVVHIDTSSIMKPLLKGLAVETDPAEQLMVMTRVLLSREHLLEVMRKTDMDLAADTPEQKEEMVRELASQIRLTSGSSRNRASAGSIYQISHKSESPQMAYKVVSTLLNTLIEDTLNSGRTDTVMAQDFLTEQIKEYEARLVDSEKRMAEFKKKNVGFMPNERGGYYTRLQRMEDKIANTSSELRLAKQRHSELRRQISGGSAVDSGVNTKAAISLRNAQQKLDDLLLQFTNEHPDVQAMRSRIAQLKANLAAGNDSGAAALDQTSVLYQELKIRESQARIEVGKLQIMLAEQQRGLEELQASVDIIPQVEADLARLDRDYQLTKERYLRLVERRESANMAQKVEQNSSEITFKVVDAPVLPLIPSAPDRPLLLAAVLIVALGAGAAWSVLMFLLFPTFVDYKQLSKAFDIPVLGTVSLQMTGEQQQHRRSQLTSYLLAMSLLLGVFGGVLYFEKPGSAHVRSLITEIGIYL